MTTKMTIHKQLTFDAEMARRESEAGQEVAAIGRGDVLEAARRIALEVGRSRGLVTADDVQRRLISAGIKPSELGNSAGSIFKQKCWEWTGRMVPSTRVSRHGNLIRVWRLVEK